MAVNSLRVVGLGGAVALTMCLTGCDSDGDSSSPVVQAPCLGPETIQSSAPGAPQVIYTSRSHNSQDAASNSLLLAAFNSALDAGSVDANALVVKDESDRPVAGKVRYDASMKAVVFDPTDPLAANQRYFARLSKGIKGSSGVTLGNEYCWQFKVAASRTDTEAQRQVQLIVDQSTYQYGIPGTIMSVRNADGSTWTTTSGYADITNKQPITGDMRFRIGSNTKVLVATAVLQLAGQGKISLDDPVNKYLANEMKSYMPFYDGNKITVRNLLQHTGGIYNFTLDSTWGNAFISDAFKRYFPQELLIIANNNAKNPNAPVYGTVSYSNTNYVLLGMLIKNVSGTVYEDAIEQWILKANGIRNTFVPRIGDPYVPSPYSHGYYQDSETLTMQDVTLKDPSTVWSSGDIISTTSDLAALGMLVGRGSMITPAMQAERYKFMPFTGNLTYGLGLVKDNYANLIGHQGGMIGYTSQMYYLPDKDATLAFFYNRTLALHDYSDVMTYTVIQKLWPGRPVASGSRIENDRSFGYSGPQGKPGLLSEY